MLLGQCVRRFACIGGDAFCSRDIYERMISGLVRCARQFAQSSQFFLRIYKALVTPRNIVVDLNGIDVAFAGQANDLISVVRSQAVGSDPRVVHPVRFLRRLIRMCARHRAGQN